MVRVPMTERAFFQFLMMGVIILILFIVAFTLQPQTYGWF